MLSTYLNARLTNAEPCESSKFVLHSLKKEIRDATGARIADYVLQPLISESLVLTPCRISRVEQQWGENAIIDPTFIT